jgi:hypothetical protein
MPARRSSTRSKPEGHIQVIKDATCPTTSGKSTLGYQIGVDPEGDIHFQVTSNDGGGFFSIEWVSLSDIQEAIETWPEDQPITSMAFCKIFRGKSANNAGFLVAVLLAEGLLEPIGEEKRVHQVCEPAPFLAQIEELRGGSRRKSPARKSKASPKAKAPAKRSAPRKKSPTRRKRAS